MSIEALEKLVEKMRQIDYCETYENDGFYWGWERAKDECVEILQAWFEENNKTCHK